MTAEQVKQTLSAHREMVISYYEANCKSNYKHYTLAWFMQRILSNAEISWARRVNISEKDVMSQINQVMRHYPYIAKGYVSNFQKAINYHGYDKVMQICHTK